MRIGPARTCTIALVAAALVGTAGPALGAGGTLDLSFSGDGRVTAFPKGATAFATTIDAKGRIVVAGYTLGSDPDFAVARFRPNGRPDPDFGGGDGRVTTDLGGVDYAFDVALASKGRIVVAGTRERPTGTRMAVAVYGARGLLDKSFSKDGIGFVTFGKDLQGANAVAVTGQDKIVLGGSTSNGGASRWALARLRPNGARDRAFGGDGRVTLDLGPAGEQINDLTIVRGGAVVAVGSVEAGLSPRMAIARVRLGGRLDRTFGKRGVKITDVANGADTAYGVAEQPDHKLIVVGHVANGGTSDWGVLRYGVNGRLDDSFGGDGVRILRFGPDYEFARSAAFQSNGRIVVVGRIRRHDDDQFGIVRLKPNGAYDLGFSKDGRVVVDFASGSDTARAVALQRNGRIVVVGEATVGGERRFAAARLLAS
jgi:uncharacterized delta-60 repeat protein